MTKKKKIILIISIILIILLTNVITYKMHNQLQIFKDKIINNNAYIYKDSNLIKNLDALKDEEDAWYTKYHFVSHSGGGIEGKIFTNSLEAWNLSYKNGNRVFDADMMFTTDKKLIVKHNGINLELNSKPMKESSISIDGNGLMQYHIDDSDNISYDKYMNSRIYNKYTPIDCEMLIEYLNSHKDLYVAIDMKDDIEESYKYVYEIAKKKEMIETLDRIIVSVYDIESYKKVNSIYNFKNYTFRQYKGNSQNYYKLVKFMIENNIHVLNVSQDFMTDKEIKEIEKKGIHVYVAVVDYISDMKYYKKMGASGFISNWLYESDWQNT